MIHKYKLNFEDQDLIKEYKIALKLKRDCASEFLRKECINDLREINNELELRGYKRIIVVGYGTDFVRKGE